MYTKGKFKPQIKLDSKSYVVLCYAKSKRNWFTEDNYRQFQLNRAEFVKEPNMKQITKRPTESPPMAILASEYWDKNAKTI
jgi:hypothetical protein